MKQLILTTIFSLSLFIAVAQDKLDRIESMRIAYITEKLNLSSAEAQQFWPIHNKYTDELKSLRKGKKDIANQLDNESISDNEAQKALTNYLNIEQQELDLKRKYVAELSKVISPKKVATLIDAEREFKQKMLDRMQQKGNNNTTPMRRPMRRGR